MIPSIPRAFGQLKVPLALAIVAYLLTALFYALAPNLFAAIERHGGDWTWRLMAQGNVERRVVLVDINEASLARIGSWPWPRQTLARLSDQLAKEGAGLQVFDVTFPEATAQDNEFRGSLLANRAIISQVFALTPAAKANSGYPQFALPKRGCPSVAAVAHGQIGNAKSLLGVPVGHISGAFDAQGQIRKQPVFVCYNDEAFPALFVVALAQAMNPIDQPLDRQTLGSLTLARGGLLGPPWWLQGLPLPGNGIPLNDQGEVRLPWWTPSHNFVAVSAADVLEGRSSRGLFEDAWVVIGSTALGLNDRVPTPFAGVEGGLLVHAQLLGSALDGNLPISPSSRGLITFLLSLLVVLALHQFNFWFLRPGNVLLGNPVRRYRGSLFWVVPVGVLLIAGIFSIKALLLWFANYWIEVVPAVLFTCFFVLVTLVVESLVGGAQRTRLFAHLASYLPKPVAEVLANQDPKSQVNATKRNITVLVADIRNFSAYCEKRPPEETTALLHAFFSMATEQAEKFGGRVESFFGDAVLMVWDHDTYPDQTQQRSEFSFRDRDQSIGSASDPDRALEAAVSLFRVTQPLWLSGSMSQGGLEATVLAPLALGIGIETGAATIGSVGLSRRRTHLVLGRAVMVAVRIQEMTVELAHPILVGEGAASQISSHRLQSQGNFLLEGMRTPCHIYAYPLEFYDGGLEPGQ